MKVLFLAHRIPYPPDKGEKIRALQQIDALLLAGHQVHVLAFVDDPRDANHARALAARGASAEVVSLDPRWARVRALGALAGGWPLTLAYFRSEVMRGRVRQAIEQRQFDALVVSSAAMAPYVPAALAGRTVVDLVDVDSEKWREYAEQGRPPGAWLYRVEYQRLRRAEQMILAHFGYTVVSTREEAALLAVPSAATGRLRVVVNGVDLTCFSPGAEGDDGLDGPPGTPEAGDASSPTLVFTGTMSYRPNADAVRFFAHQVLPRVRRSEPRARLLVVGRDPTAAVRKLEEQEGVVVTGTVEDVRPYLRLATACVAPLRTARGVQNKVLEAMASGRAVIASPEAASGLAARAGEHLVICREAADWAATVVRVLGDAALRERLGAAARRFVERHHDSREAMRPFVALVEAVAGQHRPPGGNGPIVREAGHV